VTKAKALCLTADTGPVSETLFDGKNRSFTRSTKLEFLSVIKCPKLNCLELIAFFPPLITTNSMDQSVSVEANNSSANQEIPRMLWNLDASCLSYNRPLLFPLPETYLRPPIQFMKDPP